MTTSTSSILFKNALQWDYRFLLWSVQHARYRRFVKNKGNFPRLRTNEYVRYSYNLLTSLQIHVVHPHQFTFSHIPWPSLLSPPLKLLATILQPCLHPLSESQQRRYPYARF